MTASGGTSAFVRGVEKAEALKEGDVFRGSYPEAEAAGYRRGTPDFTSFVAGYLDALDRRFPNGFITDPTGHLKNLEKLSGTKLNLAAHLRPLWAGR